MNKWTKTWPTTPGLYWFYGWPYGRSHEGEPWFYLVEAVKNGTGGISYVRSGHFFYEVEGAEGQFIPVTLPDPPRPVERGLLSIKLCQDADQFQPGTRVKALFDVRDNKTSRVLKAGQFGVVVMRYPNTVIIRPEGKKLTVETYSIGVLLICPSTKS